MWYDDCNNNSNYVANNHQKTKDSWPKYMNLQEGETRDFVVWRAYKYVQYDKEIF